MMIELPESMRAELEAKAKAAGYPGVAEYFIGLVGADEAAEIPPGPLTFRTREELEKLLDEGWNDTETIRVDGAYWAEFDRRRAERRAAREGRAS